MSNQQYGHRQQARHKKGHYKAINEGLVAAITAIIEEHSEDDNDKVEILNETHAEPEELHNTYELPPDIAVIGYTHLDLKTLDEALHGLNAREWQDTLEYEICQLQKLGTWVVEDLPQGQMVIPCSEVVRVKQGPNGDVQSYRVRIVAGSHKQIEGVNYTETFLAAAKMPTVHVVLANAAHQDWEIEHVDVKSAYLNAPLNKVIYMKPPRGVLKLGQEGKVLRLLKGLYGLKQAGRGWCMEMAGVFMNKLGFRRSAIDHSVFYQKSGEEHTIVVVAMDDMAVTSRRSVDAEHFKSNIKQFWDITDHGPIKWFLGFEIRRDSTSRTVLINQCAYIEAMVDKFRLTRAKKTLIPIDPHTQYLIKQCPSTITQVARMKDVLYCEVIRSILWPTVISRPDTAYAVEVLSQFMQNLVMSCLYFCPWILHSILKKTITRRPPKHFLDFQKITTGSTYILTSLVHFPHSVIPFCFPIFPPFKNDQDFVRNTTSKSGNIKNAKY